MLPVMPNTIFFPFSIFMCGIPVAGVIPYTHVDIDDEDSLTERFGRSTERKPLDIAVIRVPRISNFTDFKMCIRDSPCAAHGCLTGGLPHSGVKSLPYHRHAGAFLRDVYKRQLWRR